jgi:hypothetical protein
MAWYPSHNAPKDRAVWLYLPAFAYTTNERGHGTSVTSDVVVGQWDEKRSAWIQQSSGHPVYPSLFSDAKADGPKPDNPTIGMD